jgi:dihydrofolate reductase
MLAYWNTTDSPFKDALNNAPKYVASNTSEPLSWPNSTPLTGDAPKAVSELKKRPGGDLHIMGSGVLIQSLMPHGLIDEYMLLIHPLVLGSGHKLFQDGSPLTTLRLVDSVTTTKGVMIATYRPAESA